VPLNGTTPVSQSGYNPYNSSNQLLEAAYDAAGNVQHVGSLWTSYDAENRLTASADTISQAQLKYAYDGNGARVQKSLSGGGTTTYVYDALGQLAAEYSPANTLTKEYVRMNGQTVAIENASGSPCATCYLTYDHLGSIRLVTDRMRM
jgi:YD repeat-containing protein